MNNMVFSALLNVQQTLLLIALADHTIRLLHIPPFESSFFNINNCMDNHMIQQEIVPRKFLYNIVSMSISSDDSIIALGSMDTNISVLDRKK
jgi:WD40 repeat protein